MRSTEFALDDCLRSDEALHARNPNQSGASTVPMCESAPLSSVRRGSSDLSRTDGAAASSPYAAMKQRRQHEERAAMSGTVPTRESTGNCGLATGANAVPSSCNPGSSTASSSRIVCPNGRFVRLGRIGKGAFKEVFRAIDEVRCVEVAWNEVDFSQCVSKSKVIHEVELLQQLRHPNIIRCCASWEDTARQCFVFVTELMTSGTLSDFLRQQSRGNFMSLEAMVRYGRQILEGLAHLHEHNVIHRDLKCSNIFVNGNTGEAKIGDLGISIAGRQAQSVIGTPEYMAPEMFQAHYTNAVDIWSFGLCLLEMATGCRPYAECDHIGHIYKKVSEGVLPNLQSIRYPEILHIVQECLTVNPANRPSAQALLQTWRETFQDVGSDEADSQTLYGHVSQAAPLLTLDEKLQVIELARVMASANFPSCVKQEVIALLVRNKWLEKKDVDRLQDQMAGNATLNQKSSSSVACLPRSPGEGALSHHRTIGASVPQSSDSNVVVHFDATSEGIIAVSGGDGPHHQNSPSRKGEMHSRSGTATLSSPPLAQLPARDSPELHQQGSAVPPLMSGGLLPSSMGRSPQSHVNLPTARPPLSPRLASSSTTHVLHGAVTRSNSSSMLKAALPATDNIEQEEFTHTFSGLRSNGVAVVGAHSVLSCEVPLEAASIPGALLTASFSSSQGSQTTSPRHSTTVSGAGLAHNSAHLPPLYPPAVHHVGTSHAALQSPVHSPLDPVSGEPNAPPMPDITSAETADADRRRRAAQESEQRLLAQFEIYLPSQNQTPTAQHEQQLHHTMSAPNMTRANSLGCAPNGNSAGNWELGSSVSSRCGSISLEAPTCVATPAAADVPPIGAPQRSSATPNLTSSSGRSSPVPLPPSTAQHLVQ